MAKSRILNKKLFIIGITIIIIIATLLFVYIGIINNPQCEDRSYDHGWECRYPQIIAFMPQNKNLEYRAKCENEGGTYHSIIVTQDMLTGGGFTMEEIGPFFYCVIPFADYGNKCNNGDDCEGDCEYVGEIPVTCVSKDNEVYECKEEMVGSCTDGVDDGYSGRKILDGKLIYQTDLRIY